MRLRDIVVLHRRASHGGRHSEVVQRAEGLWIHPSSGRRKGCVCAHFGCRKGRSVKPQRRPAARIRRSVKQGQAVGTKPQSEMSFGRSSWPACKERNRLIVRRVVSSKGSTPPSAPTASSARRCT